MRAVKAASVPPVQLAGGRSRPAPQAHKQPRATATGPQRAGDRPIWDFSQTAVTPPLILGSIADPLEHAATHAASAAAGSVIIAGAHAPSSGQSAPAIVSQAVAAPGRPLDEASRAVFERRYHHDFSAVRVHADDHATRSARAIDAAAYTVGDHIVMGSSGATPDLLAHELAHVVQQSGAASPWVQRQPATTTPTPAPVPHKNFVFLMGADKDTHNPFYTMATRYFHAHVPTATFVDDQRSLEDMLAWLATHASAPIGDLYIVSHGNEDGTLAFGLTGSDDDGHMSVMDLRAALHPGGNKTSSLTSVASLIDAKTTIHIKGCDIGRTQAMVELIDEAFGGAGVVTAPTHEQEYSTDPTLGDKARTADHDRQIGSFTARLPALPTAPAPVDKTLKGDARKQADADFKAGTSALKTATAERKTAIAEEETRIKPQLDATAEEAGTIDSLSGPMFQRPGTTLFKMDELKAQVDDVYGHLSEAQRKSLAKRLAARDPGVAGDQQGQKVVIIRTQTEDYSAPASLAEAKVLFAESFAKRDFIPESMTATDPGAPGGDFDIVFERSKPPEADSSFDPKMTIGSHRDSDATILGQGRAEANNPGRYAWRVESKHAKSGITTLTAIGERVIAYLHHGLINASPHDHFSPSEADPQFYATSTFVRPPPPTPPAKP